MTGVECRSFHVVASSMLDSASSPRAGATDFDILDARDMLGKRLAHYTIVEALGRGGRARYMLRRTKKLGRRVALEILPSLVAQDETLRARFEREAKVIASLNHPNIVHVYSVEEIEGVRFFTMELVRGKTLTEILAGGHL